MGLDRNIDITPQQRKTILSLLDTFLPNTTAWVYGSRVKWTSKPSSDLDMVVFSTSEQTDKVSLLREAFDESDLPFRVDLHVWDDVPDQFRKNIKSERVVLKSDDNRIEWPKIRFGDLYESPSRNGLTKPKRVRGKGVKFINMGEIFSFDRMLNISCDRAPLTDKEKETSLMRVGDLLFARQSLVLSGAGKCSIFMGDNEPVAFESHLIRVRVNQKKVIPEFLYYFFYSSLGKAEIWTIIEQGAGQAGIRGSDLVNLKVPCPPFSDQKSIAHILGSLDDKIELNRQMNATLEAMAQALFKSWFVDFDPVIDNALAAGNNIPEALQLKAAARQTLTKQNSNDKLLPDHIRQQFPCAFEFSETMGWIPEGWEVKTLDTLINLIGGGTPKTSISEYWDGDIPWFSVADAPNISDVFVVDTEKHITTLGVKNSSTKILPIGTTIISARGTVGKCAMVARPMAMNQSCYGIRGKDGISDSFVYYAVLIKVAELQQRSHGSVFNTITRDTFRGVQMPFGGADLTLSLENFVKPYFEKILDNSIQTTSLSKLRDTLLPKLLSGELRIPDAEKLVKEAL